MKRLFTRVLLLAGLTACAGASFPIQPNCQQGVCIRVRAIEPIRFGEPVTVTVTVTSEKDISDLKVFLSSAYDALIEEAQDWKQSGVNWVMEAKANRTFTFTRRLRFPSREGEFQIIAEVYKSYAPSVHATDSIRIHLTREGGKVYLSGTPLPITPGPLPTSTKGPSPTLPRPTPTSPRPTTPTRPPYP